MGRGTFEGEFCGELAVDCTREVDATNESMLKAIQFVVLDRSRGLTDSSPVAERQSSIVCFQLWSIVDCKAVPYAQRLS